MNRVLSASIGVAFMACGCVTPQKTVPLQETKVFEQPFDKVWPAVVSSVSGDWPLQVIEKDSGILETQMVSLSWPQLRQRAIEPSAFLAVWSEGRGRASVYVQRAETNCTVRIKTHWEGFESNVSKSWHVWDSAGTTEAQLFQTIESKLQAR
jgi:hypothetical protein